MGQHLTGTKIRFEPKPGGGMRAIHLFIDFGIATTH